MKRIIASIVAAGAVALGALAAQQVKWLDLNHNFGAFDEGLGPVSYDFRFVNTTSEPISIVNARASCGCTSPKYTREPIAPGDTASITVTYDPAGRPGHFSKYVAVNLSGDIPQTKLTVEGTVVGSAESVARRYPAACGETIQLGKGALMVGEVTKGQRRTVFLDAYNRSTHEISPVVENMPSYLDVTVSPETVPPGQQFTYIFYMHSDKCPLYGIVSDSITIRPAAGSPEGCTIPAIAVVREDFSKMTPAQLKKAPKLALSETSLDFGRLSDGVTTRQCVIRNTGKSPLKIRRVYTADPGVSVSVSSDTVKPGKEATITVSVDRQALPGALLNARVSNITNDPDASVTNLRVVGEL